MGHRTGSVVAGALILVAALAIRLGAVAATSDYRPVADPLDYDRIAHSIAGGHGYPDSIVAPGGGPSAFRPPAYPYFLAAVYAVTGARWTAARVVQAFVGTLIVALIGLIAWQLWGTGIALVALGVGAVYPPLVAIGTTLLSEPLFLVFELGALAAVLALRRSERRALPWAVAAGVLVGLASLTRSVGPLLAVPLVVGVVWPGGVRAQPLRRGLALAGALLAAAALTIAPWTIRNAVVLDAFVPISTENGYTLAGTYNEVARTDPRYPAAWRPAIQSPEYLRAYLRSREGEVAFDARLRRMAIDELRDHPGYALEVGYRNAGRLLYLVSGSFARLDAASLGISRGLSDLSRYGFWIVGALALAGAFTRAARRAPAFVWAVPALMGLVVFVIGVLRFRAPIDPFVVLLAALALDAAARRLRAARAGGTGVHEPRH